MIKYIQNIGDFFSSNYFDEDFAKKVIEKSGHSSEENKIFNKKISGLKDKYFRYKQNFIEGRLRTKDKITHTHQFHTLVLNALGYEGDQTEYKNLYVLDKDTVLPIRQTLFRGESPFLMIMEMQSLISIGDEEPDGLFEQQYCVGEEESQTPPQKYHRSQWGNVFKVPDGVKISPMIINKAVSQLFLLEQHRRPKYILLLAGNKYYLLEQEKWFRGSYLEFDIEELFSEVVIKKDYYALFYFLIGKEALAPLSDIVLMDQLDEDSHKSAYEVTKDLKGGVIHAVEAIANEAVYYLQQHDQDFTQIDANQLKDESLNYVYRLLFLFYAESRGDLDIVPSNDQVYQQGYSLEMLRDLEQVPLNSAQSQNGFFFHASLARLFDLLSTGYRETENGNRSFKVRHLDSPLFDDDKLSILSKVKLRNRVWQDVILQLSLTRQQKGKPRGRISYANLGINQLGSVYESLLAFRGFFAETDYIEVHRKRKKNESSEKVANSDGSFLVPRHRIDDFEHDEVYYEKDDTLKVIDKGTFIYRLNGRDRQKSASYYTPEVLTQTTVKYTLKSILEKLDRGEMKALELLDLKILEPAMGAAAFHNEAINQIAEAYLQYRQLERNKKVEPDKFREELQKVKAYIALNNVYGVDINPTAVELGKLSLWLNVIHKDMQTPFFGYRLGVGNAVVGTWLKVYKYKDFSFELSKPTAKTPIKKEWWNLAPKHLKFGKHKINRKENEIYHFLLPDKGMVPSAGIRLLKVDYPQEAKHISDWKKEFCAPIRGAEFQRLKNISKAIDYLLEEHYQFQRSINVATKIKEDFYGAYEVDEQIKLTAKSYNEKERLANNRNANNAPYYKLKVIMDYWSSLWFWDMREAKELPTRTEWYSDLENILNIDFDTLELYDSEQDNFDELPQVAEQTSLFGEAKQISLKTYKKEASKVKQSIAESLAKQKTSLFSNKRSELVLQYADRYSFFHYELEFIEVFKERGGFDVIVGNPPWVNITMDEAGILSERNPEIFIRKLSAPKVKKLASSILSENPGLEILYKEEFIWAESTKEFLGSLQNYPLLQGQRNNLYKCILTNSLILNNIENGMVGLVHPPNIFDESKASLLRKYLYSKLRYFFSFRNELKLFSEVHNNEVFSINVYGPDKSEIGFKALFNIFHPRTIDGSFISSKGIIPDGIKSKNDKGVYEWNITPNFYRIIDVDASLLLAISKLYVDNENYQIAQLISIHSTQVSSVIKKLSSFKGKLESLSPKITDCWNETNAPKDGILEKSIKVPVLNKMELVLSGPHFFVGQPFYKSPRSSQKSNKDYDTIDLTTISDEFLPSTNYIPSINFAKSLNSDFKNWLGNYKVVFSKMLWLGGERTCQSALALPQVSHTNGVISVQLQDEDKMLELLGLCSSVVIDFYIKSLGRDNLYPDSIIKLPLGVDDLYYFELKIRVLRLNCLNKYYSELWQRTWLEKFKKSDWSIYDNRLSSFTSLTKEWEWETPLRNLFERRLALVEIDVITAMALGLILEELILIYNVQFPVLQQNEDDTWYDTEGNIVFTCSKGLTGVGVDRPIWNTIKDLKPGETYEHTIEKSELYYGKKVTYHAPFDKCDRVEDYKVAWEHFEKVFKPPS